MNTASSASQTETVISPQGIEYQVVNGTSYHAETPAACVRVLEEARRTGTRVRIRYGTADREWISATPERGTIGRSGGTVRVPLLIRTARSYGGEALLDHCIREISRSSGGQVLYRMPGALTNPRIHSHK